MRASEPRAGLAARGTSQRAARVTATALALLAAFAAACGGTTTSGTGQGGLTLPDGAGAGSDSGGPGGDGSSASETAGGGDATTGGGDIAATTCVAVGKGACDDSSECGSDTYCDPCSRTCEKPRGVCDPCTNDVQCAKADLGSVCIAYAKGGSACGLVCLGDAGCPPGHACKDVGAKDKQCVPKTGSCGALVGGCKSDVDCPFGNICNAAYATCTKGCGADNECAGGKICALFRCVAPCSTDAECKQLAAEAVCEAQRCKIPGGCLGQPDCPAKATYCDMATHKCVNGCKVDGDCKEFGMQCQANSCIPKGCKENWECSFGEVCEPASGKCKAAEGPYCAPCDAQDQDAKACGGAPHKCFGMQDAEGNKKGDFCGLACSDAANGPCPQGYSCMELKDDKGASQGKYCLRQCWTTPFDGSSATP